MRIRVAYFKIIGIVFTVLALIGYFLRGKLQIPYLDYLVGGLFIIGIMLSRFMSIKQKQLDIQNGTIIMVGKGYHFYNFEYLVFLAFGLLILGFEIPEMIRTKEIDWEGIVLLLFFPLAGLLNLTKHFLIIDRKRLTLKGVDYKLSDIDLSQLFDNVIRIQMRDKSKDILLNKLAKEYKIEIFNTLCTSKIGDKIQTCYNKM